MTAIQLRLLLQLRLSFLTQLRCLEIEHANMSVHTCLCMPRASFGYVQFANILTLKNTAHMVLFNQSNFDQSSDICRTKERAVDLGGAWLLLFLCFTVTVTVTVLEFYLNVHRIRGPADSLSTSGFRDYI